MSKRKLLQLVQEAYVEGWDDPRMPTISGMRRRGYTAAGIREFVKRAGIHKREKVNEISLLEFCVREDLNKIALRRMVVFDPLLVKITNMNDDETIPLTIENNPEDESTGHRQVLFSNAVYIESEDFMENPPKKFFRMAIGQYVRLKGAYIVRCDGVVKDDLGKVIEVHCSYIPESKSGNDTSGIKAQGTLHWVNKHTAIPVQVREYDRLFKVENPSAEDGNFKDYINENSLNVIEQAWAEPALAEATTAHHFQFLRKGYFILDSQSENGKLKFNRTVSLKDTWAKSQA
jgi:glutaminyl-tRNA synthetase